MQGRGAVSRCFLFYSFYICLSSLCVAPFWRYYYFCLFLGTTAQGDVFAISAALRVRVWRAGVEYGAGSPRVRVSFGMKLPRTSISISFFFLLSSFLALSRRLSFGSLINGYIPISRAFLPHALSAAILCCTGK
jgi:hypothetical protein